jgi:hypothetical protein
MVGLNHNLHMTPLMFKYQFSLSFGEEPQEILYLVYHIYKN